MPLLYWLGAAWLPIRAASTSSSSAGSFACSFISLLSPGEKATEAALLLFAEVLPHKPIRIRLRQGKAWMPEVSAKDSIIGKTIKGAKWDTELKNNLKLFSYEIIQINEEP